MVKKSNSPTKKTTLARRRNVYFPDGSLDYSKLRFVIYARKSTEEDDKQHTSIPRQVERCQEVAKRNGYNVVDIKTEQHSARYSGRRPVFNEVLSKVESGEYDAILAYHPDRLSRNMLEAGMLLDMLCPGKGEKTSILKTLVFSELSFSNDSPGRMMLAVLFVMATQYSEHLQEVTTAGRNKAAELGKAQGNWKWGYIIDEKGDYIPDPKFFDVIRHGWDMVLNGATQTEVLDYWRAEDVHTYTKTTPGKDSRRVDPLNPTSVSRIFTQTIYYGILEWDGIETDLRGNGKFRAMVTQEEWDRAQYLIEKGSNGRKRRQATAAKERFLPLRGLVHCHGCGEPMYPYVGGKKNAGRPRLLYYRCQNKCCPYGTHEVRGYKIFNQLYEYLENITLREDAYKQYQSAVSEFRETEMENLRNRRLHLEGQKRYLGKMRSEQAKEVRSLTRNPHTAQSVLDDANAKVEEYEENIVYVDSEIAEIDRKLDGSVDLEMTEEMFLNLLKNAKKQMENGNFVQKDTIARILFSNLEIDNQKCVLPICKDAFSGLLSTGDFTRGGSRGA